MLEISAKSSLDAIIHATPCVTWDPCSTFCTLRRRMWCKNVIAQRLGQPCCLKSPGQPHQRECLGWTLPTHILCVCVCVFCSMRVNSLSTLHSGLVMPILTSSILTSIQMSVLGSEMWMSTVCTARVFRVASWLSLRSGMACSEVATEPVVLVYSTRKSLILLCLNSLARLAHQATCLLKWSSGALHCCRVAGRCFPHRCPAPGQPIQIYVATPITWAIRHSGEWFSGKSVEPMSHSRRPLGGLGSMLIDIV